MKNRQWLLKTHPQGLVGREHFEWRESEVPALRDGEVLVRALSISCDPTQRSWLRGGHVYEGSIELGKPMRAYTVGEVAQTRNDNFKVGDRVFGTLGWQDYTAVPAGDVSKLRKLANDLPPNQQHSLVGLTALTAYFGMIEIGRPKTGDVVVVSGAAGATGSVAGQIARIKGAATIVGIAGGPDKCRWLTAKGGFDAAIDYKNEDVDARLRALCPKGVDLFFDNVAGQTLDAALANLAFGARIVLCGLISTGYGSGEPYRLKNYGAVLVRAARLEGFHTNQFATQFDDAMRTLTGWHKAGKLHIEEHVFDGLEHAPDALQAIFTGKTLGKTMVRVADATGRAL